MNSQIDDYILKLIEGKNVSDIHLKTDKSPMLRVDGDLFVTKFPVLTKDAVLKIAYTIMRGRHVKEWENGRAVDTSYMIGETLRFRVNIFRQRTKPGLVMRLIPIEIPRFEELNLPKVMPQIAMEPRGLILVTGITGSGKSTTLASMIQYVNERRKFHILSIEDPIEFVHRDKQSSISQIEIGADAISFESAVTSSLREDPDIILVGEMRDLETVKTAIKAAEMGYLIFSTLHTTDAQKTINRILDVFPARQQQQVRLQLASTLKDVLSMRLLPKASGTGRVPAMEILRTTTTVQ